MGSRAVSVAEVAAELLRWNEAGCRLAASPSPFYAELLRLLAADADAGGAVVDLLARTPLTLDSAPPLRLLGGVHRGVLEGAMPALRPYWPGPATEGDPAATHAALQAVFADPPEVLLDALVRDPQTNEVGRSAALATGLGAIAAATGHPIRLREIGSSGGLNLRMDRYSFRAAGGAAWGDAASAVCFHEDGYVGSPPLAAGAVIADRRGCDIHPIDAGSAAGASLLLSYVWPDQRARLARLRAALDIAAIVPVTIDRAPADDWLDEQVVAVDAMTTVVMHSIMWQYLPESAQHRIRELLRSRGEQANATAPLAWLRLEPAPDLLEAELRCTIWPGGNDQVLATSGYHGPPVTWHPKPA
jgi:hypothetical protein